MKTFYSISVILCFCFSGIHSQISPGKLSSPHSHLEGLANCTQCHTLGEKIAEEKCLQCHTSLQSRIKNNKGYHVSTEIKGKSCISCHSEHHGTKFQMIRFDEKNFNHQLAGYELKGKHKTIDCRSCHKAEFISQSELKKDANTFLGLETKCTSCHTDNHQSTLGNNCKSCHGFDGFKPAPFFDHQKSKFPLHGAHKNVSCESCHPISTKEGKTFQQFRGIEFKNCTSCHKDPHLGKFGKDCRACHHEESFTKIRPGNSFNHSITSFVLEGKHKTIDCRKCHDNRPGTISPFQEFSKKKEHLCIDCHEDIHANKFGNDCAACHSIQAFKPIKNNEKFNHALTTFPLEGKHTLIDCKQCHTSGNMTTKINHAFCKDCHADFHKGQFDAKKYDDCKACHHVGGFQESLFGIEQHQQSRFQLKGSHMAIECAQCHKKTKEWSFANMDMQCKDCHQNIHQDQLAEKFYEPNSCSNCHSEESWSSITFDHDKTSFPLIASHLNTTCRSCHFIKTSEGVTSQVFHDLNKNCIGCHSDHHEGQFKERFENNCSICHNPSVWNNINFDHNLSRFPLEGAHLLLTCSRCHVEEERHGKKLQIYKLNKVNCVDCHL